MYVKEAREVFSKVFQDNEINVTSSKVVQGWVIFFLQCQIQL